MAAGLDYETTSSYSLTVQAADGNGGTASATVSISITDVSRKRRAGIRQFSAYSFSDSRGCGGERSGGQRISHRRRQLTP